MTTPQQSALRWLPTFLGFPLGGVAAELIVGPVDTLLASLAGGAITGAILGAVQSWGMRPVGPDALRWIVASAVGFAVGLGIGSAVVDYGTSVGELATQGLICGLAVGAAQSIVLLPVVGSRAFVWTPVLGALWALGWVITTAGGIDVDSQWTVFGSSGALVVTAATAGLPIVLTRRAERTAS